MTTTEERITEEVRAFELGALLCLLRHEGYAPSDIAFRCHHSSASQSRLIDSVQFHPAQPRVEIFLNYGLLSAQTPLPSYFQRTMDDAGVDGRAMRQFLSFFDHRLIESFLLHAYPETNPHVFPDWEEFKRHFVTLLDLRSVATLQWLFSLVFPELDVRVRKAVLDRGLSNAPIVLGHTALGNDAVFGGRSRVQVQGAGVTLFGDDDTYLPGTPWPVEIRRRLDELVFPLLSHGGADLDIVLVIRTQKTVARLHGESYLGYDRIRGGEASYRRLRIFTGHLPD